jgi:hypothetical protein
MISLEGTLKAIAIFFTQLLRTIIDPCFRTKKFIKKIQSSPEQYINPMAFVFIAGIVLYYFNQVASEGFLSILDPNAYILTFRHFQKISVTNALLASLPFVLFTYLFLFIISFLLFAKNPWHKVFMRLYVYWFSSSLLLACMILLMEPLLSFLLTPYNKDREFSNSNTVETVSTWIVATLFVIAGIGAIISIVWGMIQIYFKANRSVFFRLLAGWVLSFALFYFIYLPVLFSERFKGKIVLMDKTLSEDVFHLEMIQDTAGKKADGFLFIDNQVDRPILIDRYDSIEFVKLEPNKPGSDTAIKLGIQGDKNEPVFFIQPGSMKLIHVQGYTGNSHSLDEGALYKLTLSYKTYPVKTDLFTTHQFAEWKTAIYLNR